MSFNLLFLLRDSLLSLSLNVRSDLLFRFLIYLTCQLPFEVGLHYD